MKSSKGSSFEREIAKKLSLWYSKGERDDIFWRTSTSGARATTRMKQGRKTANSAGDLSFIHQSGKSLIDLCIIEIKRGYNRKKTSPGAQISILSLLDIPKGRKRKPVLFGWWDKIEQERVDHNRKYSFVIFRRDRHNACICMHKKTFDTFEKQSKKLFMFPKNGPWVHVQKDGYNLIIFLLDDFLKWCKPSMFFRKIKRREL